MYMYRQRKFGARASHGRREIGLLGLWFILEALLYALFFIYFFSFLSIFLIIFLSYFSFAFSCLFFISVYIFNSLSLLLFFILSISSGLPVSTWDILMKGIPPGCCSIAWLYTHKPLMLLLNKENTRFPCAADLKYFFFFVVVV